MSAVPIKGRGAASNPPNRFEEIHLEPGEDLNPDDERPPSTRFFRDQTKTILNYNDSPDVGFEVSVNPYRGCEHGCIYCYARPTHEYLGFSSGLDFETQIMVKENAPELLRQELASPKWKPRVVALSGVTDCYQPIERQLKLTRRCLEVFAEFRNPVCIVTKNHLVTRDADVLGELARHEAAVVFVSITTLDPTLTPKMEPRASLPAHRLGAIRALREAGVPVGVMVAPVIPALTDHEMPRIIAAAMESGAQFAGYVTLRLPFAVGPLFADWLGRHFPARKEKVLNRVRALRGGKINDPNFGTRMTGEGIFAEQIEKIFEVACRKAGILGRRAPLSAAHFRSPSGVQLSLFDRVP
ncbi:MAG: PA0069 family radical SAM protein [Verrucomicrobia bacterium]|nr:PA0069 family radical SAM protein [Verrucomicrobiota bacterium]